MQGVLIDGSGRAVGRGGIINTTTEHRARPLLAFGVFFPRSLLSPATNACEKS
jgi:hypothetical protein